ncbi:gamma-glutamylcyclotransferase [Coleophoma cylindrospora]|uniref:glutathione-specific gamma-glutamylcyclotransferase n=1 Tax=Coleophoma cylindrospora TaxID=1849047 RepID=A0A3D8R1C1_9HELO|nr:gamma-glutamylcyclotransferase [Coleophoma cylindrospora]
MAAGGSPLAEAASDFWIFGYGSLIWKGPPHFDQRVAGYVTGYVRRFWQMRSSILTDGRHSQDHRGTPEAPGRVVTLLERSFWETLDDAHESGSDKVWGTAYRIEASKVDEVKEYLDIREINGYTVHYTDFHPADGTPTFRTMVYIGTPDNDQFVGPQDPQKLAEHIQRSEGPSGLNKDYLFGLEKSLDELSPESGDGHVKDLANRVRDIEEQIATTAEASRVASQGAENEVKKTGTHDQEETEK